MSKVGPRTERVQVLVAFIVYFYFKEKDLKEKWPLTL